MAQPSDLIGHIFGELKVIGKAKKKSGSDPVLWICECSCKGKREVRTYDLTHNRVTHCGCKFAPDIYPNQRFGLLTAKEYTEQRNSDGKRLWRCVCDCKNETYVTTANLKNGHTKSCGCQHYVSKVKIDDTFGSLTVTKRVGSDKKGCAIFLCRCDCGRADCVHEKAYPSTWLLHGQATGCNSSVTADLTNKQFGHVTALRPSDKRSGTNILWECVCECGETIYRTHANLKKSGKNTNCGCLQPKLSKETFHKAIHITNETCIEKIESKKAPANNKSGVRGVYFNWRNGKWRAYIGFQKKQINLGEYVTLEEAVKARERAEEEIYEPFLEQYYESLQSENDLTAAKSMLDYNDQVCAVVCEKIVERILLYITKEFPLYAGAKNQV